ncbi:HNH endonuclease [Geodermatophilus sp. SYSU D00705]
MARRSKADVPNRIVRIFLEHAGEQYDRSRGFKPYSKMTDEVLDHFGCACAYCGAQGEPLVEEHVVPINRESVGLHAWGNLVPACKPCNAAKRSFSWRQHMAALQLPSPVRVERTDRTAAFIAECRYEPDVEHLKLIVSKLYDLSDRQTRGLIEFGLLASAGVLQGLHEPAPAIDNLTPAT